jgi:serine/threonine protein kinase
LAREVAIKVLSVEFAANKERVARFEQEAQAAGALNHPNILAIHDVDTADNILLCGV